MSDSPAEDRPDTAWTAPEPPDAETALEERRLADELRRIIDRLVLVRPEAADLRRAADSAKAFGDLLDELRPRGADGVVSEAGLRPTDHLRHSPLSGSANPLAPPVELWTEGELDGHPVTRGTVRFGAAYEGPPGHVHGGMVAAMFDELLGRSQGSAGFTGRLTITYRRPTPLHRDLDLRAAFDRVEGRKRWITATCHLDGVLLTEAEGLFIAPRGGDTMAALAESLVRNTAP
ncbi:MAG: PaaI family thioesterase [Mycobacteriales bacterium]|nr:PaaI family thioesterase [Mycobacteriales bacterium]